MQISSTNPLKPLSGDGVAFDILVISLKNSGKKWCNRGGFAAFSFGEPSAAQDFRGNEISMADNSLQKTAKTASRAMWLRTPPAGSVHLMNASEH